MSIPTDLRLLKFWREITADCRVYVYGSAADTLYVENVYDSGETEIKALRRRDAQEFCDAHGIAA